MEICFLVPGIDRSGGVDVVLSHARHLAGEHGAAVSVVLTASPAAPGFAPGDEAGEVEILALADAERRTWDVAVATWWTTVADAHRLDARRRVLFLQGFEALFYTDDAPFDRLGALTAIAASDEIVAVSDWLRDIAAAVSPDSRVVVASPGIDKGVFGGSRRPPVDGPLRVLVEGHPSLWFKGVEDAIAAVAAMERPAHVTVVALEPEAASGLDVDRIVGGLSADQMASLYREVDVVVKLSRFEGLGLAPLEAFHAGVPCVVTPYGGHADYVADGRNGFVVGFDDRPATTRALERLDVDRGLLAELSAGALKTADGWPDTRAAAATFYAALHAGDDGATVREDRSALLELVAAQTEVGRAWLGFRDWQSKELQGALSWNEEALTRTQQEVHELRMELRRTTAALRSIQEHPAYRVATAVRGKFPGR